MTAPTIGFTTARRGDGLLAALVSIIIRTQGGRPKRLVAPPAESGADAVDGLILLGGLDIHPSRWDAEVEVESRFDAERDEREYAWLDAAERREIPIFGICRGLQMLNVYSGGDLHQLLDPEVTRTWPNGPVGYLFFRKPVEIEAGSLLSCVFGRRHVEVNSLHRRAVKTVAPGFRSVAKEDSGGVQAIESCDAPLRFGVQFHPELLVHRRDMRRLFRRFILACAENARQRPSRG